ncbi:metallophosphoesterase [Chlorobaculum sp. MV4-Y]|uniref:metallophosphoesterase n=1 Tax=Chlorobaculum sp. MV4-Y TaxID=2976335 RepID=UPI0021AE809E|nr:metallophosphoesterase [Chlorobaculum sp. MV4-Y]UWX57456.1 metallophosphoesterase [Chlorobaculum sp. MV4-Y]
MSEMDNKTLWFGIVTDIHYNPETETGNSTETGLARGIEQWMQEGAEFVIQLGDLISREGPEAEADLIAVRDMLARFPGKVYHIAGNHCLTVSPERYKAIMGLESLYYTFAQHGTRFIALDGMEVSAVNEPQTEADRHLLEYYRDAVKAPFYCGAIGARQLEWLVNELDLALKNEEPVIILSHLPLLEETTDEKHGLLWNHEEVVAILSRYPNVRAVLSGHYHSAKQAVRGGVQFVVLAAFGDKGECHNKYCLIMELSGHRLVIRSSAGQVLLDVDIA